MASKRPFINEINKRLEFAKANVSCDYDFCFIEEEKFIVFQSGGKQIVWPKSNTSLTKKTWKHQ